MEKRVGKKASKKKASGHKKQGEVKPQKQSVVKPQWENVYDPDYREYFVTQAQLSKSIRKDGVFHLTFYDENIVPLQGKPKRLLVERKIKTTLVIPEKALERMVKFFNRVLSDESKAKTSEEPLPKDAKDTMPVEEQVSKEMKAQVVETSYIR
ncbi:MAG: hypothetical protein PHG85_06705 [Candidatus Altiarchaeota archaeon]|nr:hypothetical protein [Candidatus Altiarchaeota archaeon]